MMHGLQQRLQWLFMQVEALFNRAFGDRLNPLYHLGSISFLLFWLICGSGLYLYAFFETGVAAAYDSVQAMTQRQWYAAGLLRSLHRYASDALVLTMLLHMLRHFAFNRLRGFRWFSWVSGVALIWGVYVSGINGYMLPWDRLAQFVAVGSFEWIDWLPGLGGNLMRNLIYPSSVSDRFFSLLAFMHIGIPLLVLLLLFIHVQRVAKARTQPPRPIAASLLLTLLALSLWQPASSQQGAADLARAVTDIRLDWFYLPMFPLLDAWGPGPVWTLLLIGSALLLALPWLPPGRRRGSPEAWRMTLRPAGHSVELRPGETLLEAGLRQGLALPYECRSGACGRCLCQVLSGQVDHGPFQPSALPESLRQQGRTLLCSATALSDLEIEVDTVSGGAMPGVQWARVEQMVRLSPDLMQLRLSLPGHGRIEFKAGQYINILLSDGQRRAFSFANAPQHNDHIELHVRRIPGGRFTGHVFTHMRVADRLRFEGPLGDFVLREGEQPILFVAGATGFAPVKSILEDAFARGLQRPMWLYWGVRQRSDLYALELARQWQREHPNFSFVPVLSEETAPDWSGRRGLVHQVMLADFPDLRQFEVYVCGSARMVEAAVPDFLAQGLAQDVCFTDAFLPAAGAANPGPVAAGPGP